MSKKTECYAIFDAHSEAKRDRAIEIAITTTGVSKATAFTYYPAWRKEFMAKPYYVELEREMKAKIKISKKAADKSQKTELNHNKVDIKTKMDNKIAELAEKLPIKEAGINWKVDVINPVENPKEMETVEEPKKNEFYKEPAIVETENIFEITKLIPVVMLGKHGRYMFDENGVKAASFEEFISKDKIDETLEALEIWERSYRKEGVQAC